MKKRVLSGIAPSGNLTIGNYIGAIREWVKQQNEGPNENWFFIADLHALTTPKDPKLVREKSMEMFMLYLACGIDPEKSNIFIQSHIPEHTELCWLLNCVTPFSWMTQMIQYKEKSAKLSQENVSVGLFDYPVLMAADILLYQTDLVPVGDDQTQHVEITREIARKFNRTYGEIFKEPQAFIPPQGARVMALDNPEKKMDKSAKSKYDYIWLLDNPEDIRQKIAKAVTDSGQDIVFDKERKGLYNLLTIYQCITGTGEKVIEKKYQGKGYGDFKNDLAELIIDFLKPIQEKYRELEKNKDYVGLLMAKGAAKAKATAGITLEKAKKNVGLVLPMKSTELKEKPEISFEDWLKIDVRIAEIKAVDEVAGADKLYKLTLDFGARGENTIVAGIKEYYKPEELLGRQIPVLANLEEKELRGIKSKGMMLCVDDAGKAILLNPEKKVENGAGIR
ncbi:MAG: tryptophan--tRNA ligase [Patescibacteria group bacterium]